MTVDPATGGWSSPSLGSFTIVLDAPVSGVHELNLVALTHANGWVASVDYIELLE